MRRIPNEVINNFELASYYESSGIKGEYMNKKTALRMYNEVNKKTPISAKEFALMCAFKFNYSLAKCIEVEEWVEYPK